MHLHPKFSVILYLARGLASDSSTVVVKFTELMKQGHFAHNHETSQLKSPEPRKRAMEKSIRSFLYLAVIFETCFVDHTVIWFVTILELTKKTRTPQLLNHWYNWME